MRDHQGELQSIVQRLSNRDSETQVESFRSEFRRLAVTQRQLISDTQRFAEDARSQQDAAVKKPDDKKTPEDRLHAVQLANMLSYVDRATQHMNSARSLTRRLQGDPAFRRWSAGLSEMKQARDQLRNPVEVLGQIIADATELAQLTQTLATNKLALPESSQPAKAPAWLTDKYIEQQHDAVSQRSHELEKVFSGITAHQQEAAKASAAKTPQQTPDPQTKQLLANIETATPLVHQANESFAAATDLLKQRALDAAHRKQIEALTSLSDARELFFDIRRLIEAIYGDELIAQRVIGQTDSQPDIARQLVAPLDKAQTKNLARCSRLAKLIDQELSQLPESADENRTTPGNTNQASKTPPDPQKQQADVRRQQLQLAQQLLKQVVERLSQSRTELTRVAASAAADNTQPHTAEQTSESNGKEQGPTTQASDATKPATATPPAEAPKVPAPSPPGPTAQKQPKADGASSDRTGVAAHTDDAPDQAGSEATPAAPKAAPQDDGQLTGPLAAVGGEVDKAIKTLEELRRLFFSLVEHLRDTAQRQADLNDQTIKIAADPSASQVPQKTGPLALRQQQLGDLAQQIAQALQKQGQQAAAAADQQAASGKSPGQGNPQQAAQAAEKLAKAGDLVGAAQHSMQSAQKGLQTIAEGHAQAKEPFAAAQKDQGEALNKLLEALALLDQNHQPPNQQQQQQNQQQQQDQQQQQEQQDQKRQQQMNANQLLQMIRDREAQRRKDKKQKAISSSGAVDKDW